MKNQSKWYIHIEQKNHYLRGGSPDKHRRISSTTAKTQCNKCRAKTLKPSSWSPGTITTPGHHRVNGTRSRRRMWCRRLLSRKNQCRRRNRIIRCWRRKINKKRNGWHIRKNERDDQQMIARLNRSMLFFLISKKTKEYVLPNRLSGEWMSREGSLDR